MKINLTEIVKTTLLKLAGEKPADASIGEAPATPEMSEFKVGEPWPDGQFEVMGQVITVKDGKIETIEPTKAPEEELPSEEEMAKKKKCEEEAKEAEIKAEAEKFAAQYAAHEAKMKEFIELKLSEMSKNLTIKPIIQAPIEEKKTELQKFAEESKKDPNAILKFQLEMTKAGEIGKGKEGDEI